MHREPSQNGAVFGQVVGTVTWLSHVYLIALNVEPAGHDTHVCELAL